MEITDAYRKARRNTAIFSGIGLAWAAAQFDLKSLDTGKVGIVDVSGASIPVIIACLMIYAIVQCTLEFMMQPDEIRRWRLAQVDYKITLNLTRVSLLALTAATVSRSLGTVVGVALGSLVIVVVYGALAVLLTFIIMPIRMRIRSRQGRDSAASAAIESASWSIFIVSILYVLLLIILSISPLNTYQPIIKLFPVAMNPISTLFFNITAFLMALSVFAEVITNKKLYAFEPRTIVEESKLPDGSIGVRFRDNPKHPGHITSNSSNKTQASGDQEKK